MEPISCAAQSVRGESLVQEFTGIVVRVGGNVMIASQNGPTDSPHDTPVTTRRRLFEFVTRAAAGFIVLGLGIPIIAYVISPALKRRAHSWVDIASVEALPAAEPTQLDCVMRIQDGYLSTTAHKAVWA